MGLDPPLTSIGAEACRVLDLQVEVLWIYGRGDVRCMTGELGGQKVQWSMRRLVELLDEAIDSAAEQLVRAESRMAWRDPVGRAGDDEPEPAPGLEM